MMTPRERILAVYNGQKPDRVPYMLDLSHYYLHKFQLPWDLCNGYPKPDTGLMDFTKQMGAAFYCPQQTHFWNVEFANDVKSSAVTNIVNGVPEIVWRFDTPIGSIERIRVWEQGSYSWAIKKWGVEDEKDLEVLAYAMSSRRYTAIPQNYEDWANYIGEDGLVYLNSGYSAMGYLMNYWMGVENTIYASYDFEDVLDECMQKINNNVLEQVEMMASEFSAPVIIMGDNFSSDVQSPPFFSRWSKDFYSKAYEIIHKHGKKVAVHVDGKLKGAIKMMKDIGADCIDAVTPGSVGGCTAAEARAEAGSDLILSGGIPNELWYSYTPLSQFEDAVKEWLALKDISPALIAAAGDQVPPGAEESRILRMTELVEEYGYY